MARTEEYTNTRDCRILQGMIVNTTVVSRIASRWTGKMFSCPWSNIVAEWCIAHYKNYGKHPGHCIVDYLAEWQLAHDDKATFNNLSGFLAFVSEDYERLSEQINPEHLLDIANEHLELINTRKLSDGVRENLEAGRLAKAQEIIVNYTKIGLNSDSGVDLFIDQAEVASVFADNLQTLVDCDKDLGLFFGGRLERDSLVSFLAPEKAGKTWWLLELAWQAMLQRRRVAFFEVGDMSKRQIEERFLVRAAQHPLRSPTGQWPYEVNYPVSLRMVSGNGNQKQAVMETERRVFKQPLNAAKAWEACQKVMNKGVKSRNSYFKLSVHPNSSVNVLGIKAVLQYWQTKDWSPDCIFIDYADILADIPGRRETRDNINLTWKMLRALSQEYHCLVVTATQSDADSYERKTLDRRNFSEDKRKLAHVTGMVGINVTTEEKEKGIMRLNWIVRREGAYSTSRCIHLATCLPLANPCVLSTF